MSHYAILVTYANGDEEYVNQGLGETPARFFNRREAKELSDFLKIGMDGDPDVDDIAIVPYPGRR